MYSLHLINYDSQEYLDMVELRLQVLRKPLGLHFTPESLLEEKNDLLIGCFASAGGKMIGCCILSPVDPTLIRLRQMAVTPDHQGKGAGKALLAFAERQATRQGYRIIEMHARKTAVPFYTGCGYLPRGGEFLELDIAHVLMSKHLGRYKNP